MPFGAASGRGKVPSLLPQFTDFLLAELDECGMIEKMQDIPKIVEDLIMDQQFEYPQACPQEPETLQEETAYRLPFAEDLYEAPVQIQQPAKKVYKPRKERAKI